MLQAAGVFLAVLFVSGSAQAVPVFTNGDMESSTWDSLTGWTVVDGNASDGSRHLAGYGSGYQGQRWACIGNCGDGTGPGGSIEQTVSGFDVGATYSLTFLQASQWDPDTTTVDIIGDSTLTNTFTSPQSASRYWDTWVEQTWTFTADATSLTFRFSDSPCCLDIGLDDFKLTEIAPAPSPVPLPATGFGLAIGLSFLVGLSGIKSRRRRSAI